MLGIIHAIGRGSNAIDTMNKYNMPFNSLQSITFAFELRLNPAVLELLREKHVVRSRQSLE